MKQIVVVGILALLITSCSVQQTSLPSIKESYLIDFRKYSSKDFLFSTSNYNGNYKSIGILTSEFFPEVKPKGRGEKSKNYDKDKYIESGFYLVEKANYDDVMNEMYIKAKDVGADAVINIEITREPHPYLSTSTMIPTSAQYGWLVSGMAIKRLD